MRPILLKGHERPLTFLLYSRESDLVFSCAKDHTPCVWFSDNGERLGTYKGHNGAVWTCDVSRDTRRFATGSGDQTVKIWDVETGVVLHTFDTESPARSVKFSEGEKELLITTDPFMGISAAVHVMTLDQGKNQASEPRIKVNAQGRVNRAVWGPANKTIISGGEDCILRQIDAQTGKIIREIDSDIGHEKTITTLAMSLDGSHVISGSTDKTSKLWDSRTMEHLKTYVTERPVNAAAISPLMDHVVIGGGQKAEDVTTTSSRAGKFEAKFFHKVYEEEIGGVRGHFGPINALAFSNDGRSFASGGEDGYVRVHHMDSDYFTMKY